jgi:hypothetical protein
VRLNNPAVPSGRGATEGGNTVLPTLKNISLPPSYNTGKKPSMERTQSQLKPITSLYVNLIPERQISLKEYLGVKNASS